MILFSLLFCALLLNFFRIQWSGKSDGVDLSKRAMNQYEKTKILPAKRGTITDRFGYSLAEDTESYTIYAVLNPAATINKEDPKHVKNERKTAKALSQYIDMSEKDIYQLLSKKKTKNNKRIWQTEFGKAGKDLSSTTKNQIDALKLPGIYFEASTKRFYPDSVFASHTIGGVGEKIDPKTKEPVVDTETKKVLSVGQFGLEKQYDKQLTGTNGRISYQSDLFGHILPTVVENKTESKDGSTIVTTIDRRIQTVLETTLSEVDKKYKPEKMIAIVMDPKTGAILAMSQRSTFNLNTKTAVGSADMTWLNMATQETIEPGSTFKIFTLAAAVNEGVFNPNATFKSGSYTYRNPKDSNEIWGTIRDHNKTGWGTINYLQAVQRSSNVGFAKLGKDVLGFNKLHSYLKKFDFDKKTGIDLPNEAAGIILWKYPMNRLTTTFGQGTVVTPMQQMKAATAIANDGKMMQPYLVEKIVDPTTNKVEYQHEPIVAGEPITPKTAKTVRNYLETVITDPQGTGKPFAIKGVDVAGKTGTAQMVGKNGKYMTGDMNHIFSFIGMAPKDDPELLIYVAVQQPQLIDGKPGSTAGATIFKKVMASAVKYMDVVTDSSKPLETIELADYEGKDIDGVESSLKRSGLSPIVIGNGTRVIAQSPAADTSILHGEKVLLLTAGSTRMPDLNGWSLADVMKFSDLLDLRLTSSGVGFVNKQIPAKNTPIKSGGSLTIEFVEPLEKLKKSKVADKNNSEKKGSNEVTGQATTD